MRRSPYNFQKLVPNIDPNNGKRLYKVYTFKTEEKLGFPIVEYVHEDAIPEGNNIIAVPEFRYDGIEFEGILYTLVEFAKELGSMDMEKVRLM